MKILLRATAIFAIIISGLALIYVCTVKPFFIDAPVRPYPPAWSVQIAVHPDQKEVFAIVTLEGDQALDQQTELAVMTKIASTCQQLKLWRDAKQAWGRVMELKKEEIMKIFEGKSISYREGFMANYGNLSTACVFETDDSTERTELSFEKTKNELGKDFNEKEFWQGCVGAADRAIKVMGGSKCH